MIQSSLQNEKDILVLGRQIFIGGKNAGETQILNGTKIFMSVRNREEHFFRAGHGWAISSELLLYLKKIEVTEVHLHVGKEVLAALVADWLKLGAEAQFPPFERQVFLAEEHFYTL